MVRNADELIKYFAVDMEDMGNFNHHLQKILIPRVPGTKGSEIVRKVRCVSNLFLALPIVIDFLLGFYSHKITTCLILSTAYQSNYG